jgi:hypothetical protein
LTAEQARQVTASDAYGPLTMALRDAQARGLNVDDALPRLIAAHPLDDAVDLGAVLHSRVDRWVERARGRREPAGNMIGGLIPRAAGVTDEDLRLALRDREKAIEQRAAWLLERAIEQQAPWLQRLGRPPNAERLRKAWLREARIVAAYRDLWNVQSADPTNTRGETRSVEQAGELKRAAAAALRALRVSQRAHLHEPTAAGAEHHLDATHDHRLGHEL